MIWLDWNNKERLAILGFLAGSAIAFYYWETSPLFCLFKLNNADLCLKRIAALPLGLTIIGIILGAIIDKFRKPSPDSINNFNTSTNI